MNNKDIEFFISEVISYLLFEDSTSHQWPFAVPFDRITMADLLRIAARTKAFMNRSSEEPDTELIHGCCIAELGNR